THPLVYLCMTLPPEHLDVNVHPTKREVNFLFADAIIDAVVGALNAVLAGANSSRVFYTQTLLPVAALSGAGEASQAALCDARAAAGGGRGATLPHVSCVDLPSQCAQGVASPSSGCTPAPLPLEREAAALELLNMSQGVDTTYESMLNASALSYLGDDRGAKERGAESGGGGGGGGGAVGVTAAGPARYGGGAGIAGGRIVKAAQVDAAAASAPGSAKRSKALAPHKTVRVDPLNSSIVSYFSQAPPRVAPAVAGASMVEARAPPRTCCDHAHGGDDEHAEDVDRRHACAEVDGAGLTGAHAGHACALHGDTMEEDAALQSQRRSTSPLLVDRAAQYPGAPVTDVRLLSVTELLAAVNAAVHDGLVDVCRRHVYVGTVDRHLSLIQHNTKLLLVNHTQFTSSSFVLCWMRDRWRSTVPTYTCRR
ncbi:hypothetical protein EON68_03285, partial [archaeon]